MLISKILILLMSIKLQCSNGHARLKEYSSMNMLVLIYYAYIQHDQHPVHVVDHGHEHHGHGGDGFL